MSDFLQENWKIVFSGIGTAVVAAVIAYLLRQRKQTSSNSVEQKASAGANSQVVQAGRDAKVGDFGQKPGKK